MQDESTNPAEQQDRRQEEGRGPRNINAWAGLLLVGIGAVLLMRRMGADLPNWLFTWPMILIVVGLFVGLVNRFRDFNWIVIMAVGGFFLAEHLLPDIDIKDFILPFIIILVGLAVLFGTRRSRFGRRAHERWERRNRWRTGWEESSDKGVTGSGTSVTDKDDLLDIVSVFGHVKRIIYSKNFKGGEVVNIFGGAEINLTQADFTGEIEIEVVQIFGGAKLVIPPHWAVHSSEAVAIFGGIEDKRPPVVNAEKVIVVRGTTVFGGLEIRSY